MYEHPDFKDNKRLSRREAWQWLIERAAWKPRGDRMSYGVADLARGQAAVTIRGLADAWGWSKGSVQHFLRWLKERDRIETAVISTKFSTKFGTKMSYRATIITICNYDKFQGIGRSGVLVQSLSQSLSEVAPQLPGIVNEMGTETYEPLESFIKQQGLAPQGLPSVDYGDKSGQRTERKTKPPHGKTWTNPKNKQDRRQFFDYRSVEWRAAAEYDRFIEGVETFPLRYLNGSGNWFKKRTEREWKEWGQAVLRLQSR
jgi:hypothetical protein